ncbi:MAG: hypothetical protein GC184_13685 [Rhizobiales bacterium]|nr:hypothetical protein [Hyphomicrobiales bacterium]
MDTEPRAKPEGIAEYLFNELRYALRDIRQKVVEEGWFGRIVTPTGETGASPEFTKSESLYGDDHQPMQATQAEAPERRPSFEERWAVREGPEAPATLEQSHEIDFDR